MNRNITRKGISVIELVIYIAILTIMTVTITTGIVRLGVVYSRARFERKITSAAEVALERIVREVRLGSRVKCLTEMDCGSVEIIDADGTGVFLKLLTYSDFTSTNFVDREIEYVQANEEVLIGGQSLTSSDVSVTDFTFTLLNNNSDPRSEMVRVGITLEAGSGDSRVERKYFTSSVLRGSY